MNLPQIKPFCPRSKMDLGQDLGQRKVMLPMGLRKSALDPYFFSLILRTRGSKKERENNICVLNNENRSDLGQVAFSAVPPPPPKRSKPVPPPPVNYAASEDAKAAGAYAPTAGGKPRWTLADEIGLPLCKRCRRPVVFGEVIKSEGRIDNPTKWMKFDPDLSPHGCGQPETTTDCESQDEKPGRLHARSDEAPEDKDGSGWGDDSPAVP